MKSVDRRDRTLKIRKLGEISRSAARNVNATTGTPRDAACAGTLTAASGNAASQQHGMGLLAQNTDSVHRRGGAEDDAATQRHDGHKERPEIDVVRDDQNAEAMQQLIDHEGATCSVGASGSCLFAGGLSRSGDGRGGWRPTRGISVEMSRGRPD